jgi:hypothetical protein
MRKRFFMILWGLMIFFWGLISFLTIVCKISDILGLYK